MPNKATVSGELLDATLAPVVGGKIVAELVGADVFDDGVRIVTQKVEATTDADGEWSMELIVNGEGRNASSTWTVTIYNQYAAQVHQIKGLFIPINLPITLSDLEATSSQNAKAAKDASLVRIIVATSWEDYNALPVNQKRDSDHVVIVEG